MIGSRMTFGRHLKQFAHSVDFLDNGQYRRVQSLIQKYLANQLNATLVAFFRPIRVDDGEGIKTVWSKPEFEVHQTLRVEGGYRRQLALSMGEKRDLWVIGGDEHETLSSTNPGVDIWGKEEDGDLPPFQPAPIKPVTKTSICIITRDARRLPNGVFLVDISDRVRPTPTLRDELEHIADAIGLLHETDRSTKEQRKGTNRAIEHLEEIMPASKLDTGPRPVMFVASSSGAARDVVEAISDVLEDFSEHIAVRPWDKLHQPGNINLQLVMEIGRAKYGICYLSEPASKDEGNGQRYRDNPNVLIEAGMLHMVTQRDGGTNTGWIPIREEGSDRAPFDLEQQRMVLVKRSEGVLDTDGFKEDLTRKLASLLGLR